MKLNLYLFSPLCFAAVLLFCANFAYAQTPVYLLDSNYTTPPIVDCNGILLDSGGNSGHYDQSDNYTIVISPPTSGCVALHLDSLNLTGNTTFTIYNGTTAGPRLAELNALSNNQTALFTAESGVMIIVFRADLLVAPGRGFAAHWECLADCSTVSPCSATIYDPQANGNYLPNQQIVTTYCPDGPNKRMKIDFSLFRLASGDTLKVYDGNSTAAPLLQSLTGFNNATYNPLATNTNTQGCLTLAFSSDTASEDAGYMGKLTCQRACQTITPSFMINATVPTYPTVAGDSAVNICTWQLLEVTAAAIYPQNDSIYHQNDSTTRYVFYWNDGTKTVTNGAPPHKAWHQYENGRIYFPRIIATDPDSLCGEISPPNFRVRVVSDPVFSNQQLPPICLGDTMQLFPLAVTVNDLLTGSFPEQLIANNTMICLPDGSSTISTILAENFNPAALSQVEHIKAVYANFEHSYAGDLKIELICPSGNSIILKNYPGSVGGGGGNYFGIANDMLSTCTEPAQGLNYGWAGPNLTTISGIPTSIANSTYQGIGGVSIPYTMPLLDTLTMNDVFTMGTHLISVSNPYMNMNSQTLQPAFYKPFQPMSLLDGCPVNGEWKLKITDNLGIDNGILYNWGIIFDDSLYPISEAYTPLYSQSWICNSTTVGSNCAVGTPTGSTSMTVVPTANINGYIYSLQYTGFPCSFYPYVSVTVKPLPAAPILSPTVICPGFSTDLVANPAICGGTSPYRPNSMNTTPFLIPDDSISFLINAIPVNLDTACHFKLKAVRLNGLAHQYYPD